ncbi:cysteine proteinase [Annulohypoxylon maeteangense]|uniref:cysteine proteinase n=1 Tax=Annulohypoxylon maeteangense TaxID=1927788 RepID=UPI002008A629|nr:cysteine proteinase [Annulohypoxylon maeteangense]KAI0886508.1 cysteine proteinase [Annulohypoxylon maeteangense]
MESENAAVYETDDLAELRRLQWHARLNLQLDPNPHPLTSPMFLRDFLASKLPVLDVRSDCASHELLEVSNQSYYTEHHNFLSLTCNRCRFHFHIANDSQHVQSWGPAHRHHMLVSCDENTTNGTQVRIKKSSYDDATSHARFICVAGDCLFNVKIDVVPWRLSPTDVAKFSDKSRVDENLKLALVEDSVRYSSLVNSQNLKSESILRHYLTDALNISDNVPLRVNKRNKRFYVSMRSDFDGLLRFLGFYEGIDPETSEACWYIPPPEGEQKPTRVRTLRARMEDALMEIDILFASGNTVNAWDKLLGTFQADYPRADIPDLVFESRVSLDDLNLLGCLPHYPPEFFSWAAILLANRRPRNRNEYLDAGLRCIEDRSYDASLEIIMDKSRFDNATPMDIKVEEAYAFFNASSNGGITSDWFLTRYYEMARSGASDEFKAQALQQLEAIGNHLGRDIVSEIDPVTLGYAGMPELIPSTSGGIMSVSTAANFLEVEPSYTAEIIRGFVERLIRKDNIDRGKVIEALNVLSNHKRELDNLGEANELQQIAEFVKETDFMPMLISQPHSAPILITLPSTPPGLKNIGNTCYLNSLLQYFYNVKLVRDLVLNFDDVKLELDEEIVGRRRTGGNGTSVNLEEAIVARQFIEMLQGLFADLQTTTQVAAHPSQKLANIALSSARDILEQQPQNIPPPLPARPSPAPPAIPAAKDNEENGLVNVTIEPVNDKLELASSQSSQTLVDETEDVVMLNTQSKTSNESAPVSQSNDIEMEDATESSSLDTKIAEVSRRLEHSDRSGTSQQDVGEIIGNILEHFMRAIRSDGPMPGKPDLQADKITETFFTTIVNYTIKTKKGYPTNSSGTGLEENSLNVEIVPERWITAYPEEVNETLESTSSNAGGENNARCTLVEALDRYFSYETIDDGNRARYSSIRTLPPILHICIQRSTPKGKNKNPVVIPEILYLDRYMEAEEGFPVWIARKRTWALKERLKEVATKIHQSNQKSKANQNPEGWANAGSMDPEFKDFRTVDAQDLQSMTMAAIEKSVDDSHLDQSFLDDIGLQAKNELSSMPEFIESLLPKMPKATPGSPGAPDNEPLSDKLGDILWDTTTPLDVGTVEEVLELRQKEETTFDTMKNEKYAIHAVICHRGGTTAGHYWVWIRDFKRNVWYRYNDETVTEDSRGTEAVLDDLNQTGDPYYVAYVRDEMKDDLVDVPQRLKSNVAGPSTADHEAPAVQEVETIEGIIPMLS